MFKKILKKLRATVPHNSPLRLWYTRLNQIIAYLFICNKKILHNIRFIGITGTDGKTTTTEMIAFILKSLNHNYISSSSLQSVIDGNVIASSKRTTPSLSQLCQLFKKRELNKEKDRNYR